MRDSDTKDDQFVVMDRPAAAELGGEKNSTRVVVLPDGRRVHVLKRDVLDRAIEAAMKEYA